MSLLDLAAVEKIRPVISKCPFCNSSASPNGNWNAVWVECDYIMCGAKGPWFYKKKYDSTQAYLNAIDAWEHGVGKG